MLKQKVFRRWAAILAGLLCIAATAACTANPKGEVPPVSSETPPVSTEKAPDVTLYDKYGLTVALPNAYLDQLLVSTEFEEDAEDTRLMTVYEKESYEASDGSAGFLFSLARYTQAQYEEFLGSDGSGQRFFARDDDYYYGYFTATDVQYYRKDSAVDIDSDGWKAWEALSEIGHAVTKDFVTRNGLTDYSDREFFDREFTYDSPHVYVTYLSRYTESGSYNRAYTLVLSQPATQGGRGLWCVERWYDTDYGTLYYVFPGGGVTAKDYYARRQAACDGGGTPELLEPIGAAMEFAATHFEDPATADSFQLVQGEPAGNVLRRCNEVFDDMGTLQAATLSPDGDAVEEAQEVPNYYDMPFRSYTSSRLYPIIWLKAERPAALTGKVVYCRSAEGTKMLTFYQQEDLLCIDTDGTEHWFKPAYPTVSKPYEGMYGFYEEFSNYDNDAPRHSYSDEEVQAAHETVSTFFDGELTGCTLGSTEYDPARSYEAAERYLQSGHGKTNGATIENVIVLYVSFTTDGNQTALEPNSTYEKFMLILLRADAASDWVVDDYGY